MQKYMYQYKLSPKYPIKSAKAIIFNNKKFKYVRYRYVLLPNSGRCIYNGNMPDIQQQLDIQPTQDIKQPLKIQPTSETGIRPPPDMTRIRNLLYIRPAGYSVTSITGTKLKWRWIMSMTPNLWPRLGSEGRPAALWRVWTQCVCSCLSCQRSACCTGRRCNSSPAWSYGRWWSWGPAGGSLWARRLRPVAPGPCPRLRCRCCCCCRRICCSRYRSGWNLEKSSRLLIFACKMSYK